MQRRKEERKIIMVELNSIEMLGFVLYRQNVTAKRFLEVLDAIH